MSKSDRSDMTNERLPAFPSSAFACKPEIEMTTGALGGALVGLYTGFFNPRRMPPPVSPLPARFSPRSHDAVRILVASSAVGWRVTKRMFVASVLYPVLVCHLQVKDPTPGVLQCAVAGGVSGAIFGFRGGPLGVLHGCGTFAAFASMAVVLRTIFGTRY